MKKIICLIAVALMIASVAFAAGKMRIAAKDLPGLKGTWTGMISFGVMNVASSPAKLEILNDSEPVKAKLTLENVPGGIPGLDPGTHVAESDEGAITTQGTILWTGQAKNFFEVSLTGKKKLSGWYFFRGVKGDVSLSKK